MASTKASQAALSAPGALKRRRVRLQEKEESKAADMAAPRDIRELQSLLRGLVRGRFFHRFFDALPSFCLPPWLSHLFSRLSEQLEDLEREVLAEKRLGTRLAFSFMDGHVRFKGRQQPLGA